MFLWQREAEASTSPAILFGCIANSATLVVPLNVVALASESLRHVQSLLNTSAVFKKIKSQQIICLNILVLLETYIREGFVKKSASTGEPEIIVRRSSL